MKDKFNSLLNRILIIELDELPKFFFLRSSSFRKTINEICHKLCGTDPVIVDFSYANIIQIYDGYQNDVMIFHISFFTDEYEARDLLKQMLNVNPTERYT